MKKRIMSLLLTAAMIVSMVVVPTAAADPVTLSTTATSGLPGEQVTVSVDISGIDATTDIGSIQADLTYNAQALEFVSGTKGTAWESTTFDFMDKGGTLSFGHMSGDSFTVSGNIASFVFQIKESASDRELPISISVVYAEKGDYTDITNDIVTVGCSVGVILPTVTEVIPDGPTEVSVPSETTYSAAVKDQWGNAMDLPVTFSLVNEYPGVSIDANTGVLTVTTAAAAGRIEIAFTCGSVTGTRNVTIKRDASAVTELTVSGPSTIAVPTVAEGGEASIDFTVAAKDQFGAEIAPSVTWKVEGNTDAKITNGKLTVTNKTEAGTVTVIATAGGKTAQQTVTITKAAPAAASVEVSGPAAGEIAPAGEAATTYQFTAKVIDQFGAPLTGNVEWAVDASGVSIDENGLLSVQSAIKPVTVTVTAKSGAVSGNTQITLSRAGAVADVVTISGPDSIVLPDLQKGTESVAFSAKVVDNYGDEMSGDSVKWTVSKANGVSIDANGVLTVATKAGEIDSLTITAQSGSARAEKTISITKAKSVATAIALDKSEVTMSIPTGDEANVKSFPAVVTDQYGDEMDAQITYSLSGDAFVSASGSTVTVKKGAAADTTYVLTASCAGLTATMSITVVDIELDWNYTVAENPTYGTPWNMIVKLNICSATLDGQKVPGKFTVVDATEIPDAGEQTFTLQFVSNDGAYTVTKTDTVDIAPKTLTVKWAGYTGLVYDRENVSVTATVPADVELTVENGDQINAGTYTAKASIDNANYVLDNAECKYTIAKAPLTIHVPDQIIKAGKTSEQLAAQIGTVSKGIDDDEIEGTVTVDADISGYKASTKAVKIPVIYTHNNPNYVNDVKTSVLVTFVEGDPQELAYEDVFVTYGDAPVANPVTVVNGGNGAVTYASDDESVATVAADGTITIVGAGVAIITATVAGEGDWMTTEINAMVVVYEKTLTITNLTPAEMVYNNDSNVTKYTGTADLSGVVEGDEVALDFTNAVAEFESTDVGDTTAAIVDIELTGADAANYIFDIPTTSAKVLKADAAVKVTGLSQTTGRVDPVTVTVSPISAGVTYTVEYYVMTAPAVEAVEGVPCANAETDPACDHSGDCGYVAAVEGSEAVYEWVSEVPQAVGSYPVRVTVTGDDNVNGTVDESNTLTVRKKVIRVEKDEEEEIVPPAEPKVFDDVKEDDWYAEAVTKAVEQKLFTGVAEKTFAPELKMNRAMMVTVLASMEFGEKGAPEAETTFTDLKADWYKNAVAWAAEKGITSGTSETNFAPEQDLTREQIAVFLYAYAKLKGVDVSVGENTNILSYNDAFSVSEYAMAAMQWACGAGLIDGTPEGNLMPQGVATRAQAAVILTNFQTLLNA